MDFKELVEKTKILGALLGKLDFTSIKRLMEVDTLFDAGKIEKNFTNMKGFFFHRDIPIDTSAPAPLPPNPQEIPSSYQFQGRNFTLQEWQQERGVCAMVVLKSGKIAHEQYLNGTGPLDRRISWSMSKSVLSATIGVLKDQGRLPHFATRIGDIVPQLRNSAYANATLRNVLNMASGVKFNEDYLDYHSDINRMGRVLAVGGSMDQFAADMVEQEYTPGQYNHYVSIDTHVLGMVIRAVTGQRTDDLVRELVFDPLGLEVAPYYLTDSFNEPFVLGGLNMTTRDYARFGLLFAQGGQINGKQVVSNAWVKESTSCLLYTSDA
ncbi:MAG: beta-lactamase family protein, partial [Rhodobacteraceae bacterium]|nr:beta-lactamase family protein [Paracoccaceae bacterium]